MKIGDLVRVRRVPTLGEGTIEDVTRGGRMVVQFDTYKADYRVSELEPADGKPTPEAKKRSELRKDRLDMQAPDYYGPPPHFKRPMATGGDIHEDVTNDLKTLEERLADDYLQGAILAREVSYRALMQALKDAERGRLRDPARTAMNAAITSGTLLDKRLLLQERPTQITAREDPVEAGLRLLRKRGILIEGTAEDVTDDDGPGEPGPSVDRLNAGG